MLGAFVWNMAHADRCRLVPLSRQRTTSEGPACCEDYLPQRLAPITVCQSAPTTFSPPPFLWHAPMAASASSLGLSQPALAQALSSRTVDTDGVAADQSRKQSMSSIRWGRFPRAMTHTPEASLHTPSSVAVSFVLAGDSNVTANCSPRRLAPITVCESALAPTPPPSTLAARIENVQRPVPRASQPAIAPQLSPITVDTDVVDAGNSRKRPASSTRWGRLSRARTRAPEGAQPTLSSAAVSSFLDGGFHAVPGSQVVRCASLVPAVVAAANAQSLPPSTGGTVIVAADHPRTRLPSPTPIARDVRARIDRPGDTLDPSSSAVALSVGAVDNAGRGFAVVLFFAAAVCCPDRRLP